MLGWWLGRADEESRDKDDDNELEPPETPAPVFAARALKSALFGTPAFPDDDCVVENEPSRTSGFRAGRRPNSISASPSKPPGILLTPGTATSRRKTVSFGNEIADKQDDVLAPRASFDGDSGRSQQQTRNHRKTTLTKALENARECRTDKARCSETNPVLETTERKGIEVSSISCSRNKNGASDQTNEGKIKLVVREDFDGDITMDLNEPHSQSGRYWKSEYQSYHEEAKTEMRKLLQYKHMAKNYAKKKDEENIDLSEKLKEQQRKVVVMEDKLAELSGRIAQTKPESCGDDEPSELVKELARQTALAVQYKKQVEEFRLALQKIPNQGKLIGNLAMPGGPYSSEVLGVGKPKDAHWRGSSSIHPEFEQLRQQLSTLERSNESLKEENTRLTQELLRAELRLELHLEEGKQGRHSAEDLRSQKDQALQTLQDTYDTLKAQAKSQRRDAEQLLKRRHDQVVDLKKEIASLKQANNTVKELQESLQRKSVEHSRVVAEYEIQIAELKRDMILGSTSLLDSKLGAQEELSVPHTASRHEALTANALLRGSQIPILAQAISHSSNNALLPKERCSETPTGSPIRRHHDKALSEIINNASPNTVPPGRTGPVHFSPVTSRPMTLSNQITNVQPWTSENSVQPLSRRTIHDRSCRPSPRPKMINIPSSPPKPVKTRPVLSTEINTNYEVARNPKHSNLASSRLSTMEDSQTRRTIPPERAAAAKARLEQKMAEKKKSQASHIARENDRDMFAVGKV